MCFSGSSSGKESACNAGEPSLIAGLGRSTREGTGYPLQYSWASLVAQLSKEFTYNAGDLGSIPEWGRSHGEGKGYSLQYSGLENSMNCIVHRVSKSRTWLRDFHLHVLFHVAEHLENSPISAACVSFPPFKAWIIFYYMYRPYSIHLFIYWTLGLLLLFGYCEKCCYEHGYYITNNTVII